MAAAAAPAARALSGPVGSPCYKPVLSAIPGTLEAMVSTNPIVGCAVLGTRECMTAARRVNVLKSREARVVHQDASQDRTRLGPRGGAWISMTSIVIITIRCYLGSSARSATSHTGIQEFVTSVNKGYKSKNVNHHPPQGPAALTNRSSPKTSCFDNSIGMRIYISLRININTSIIIHIATNINS